MFINCRHCNALVATDPATDLPPERCPRCAGVLRRPESTAAPSPAAGQAPAVPDAGVDAVAAASTNAAAAPVANEPPPGTAPEARSAGDPAGDSPPATTREQGAGDADRAPEPATAPADAAPAPATPPAGAGATGDAGPDPAEPLPPPLPDVDPSPSGNTAPAPAPATVADAADPLPDAAPSPSGNAAQAPAPDAADKDTPAPPATTEPGPGFLSSPAPAAASAGRARRWHAAAIVALALLLGLQVLLADRARLAADARWRPLVAAACDVFGCGLPPWREPAAFVLVAREVRPHPEVPGALRVRATFRNDARWPQAWPMLLLTLSDVDGRPVAARAFRVDEYLGATTSALVAPGQTADIALDIREPSIATVAFAFDFGQ